MSWMFRPPNGYQLHVFSLSPHKDHDDCAILSFREHCSENTLHAVVAPVVLYVANLSNHNASTMNVAGGLGSFGAYHVF
ncbi:hypothetical protein OS493_021436 [Desmophyllum pertusum]|uniref:Uncharacterized protein n=1 Tax=Desmophyllum pertusum TaxID=174260 RepID=A0A9W9Z2H9_9CNID|nr:hypothetical protein OS493_021436 [Desmophyllum pertusum]